MSSSSIALRHRNETKQNLVLSALSLFAEQGIDAVSMRTINNAAGTRNASAVHYHFGNKAGIIEAIIDFVRETLDDIRTEHLTKLEARLHAGDTPDVRDVMWAMTQPYALLRDTPEFGLSAIRFLARLQSDMTEEIQDYLNRDPQLTAERFDTLYAHALPLLPDNLRRARVLFCWTQMIHGFAGTSTWENTRFGNLQAESREEAMHRFFDYLVGGLTAPISETLPEL